MKNTGTQRIETNRLILRKITTNDASDMFNNWTSDVEVARYLTWDVHKTIEDTKEIISIWEQELEENGCYRWCIELKDINEVIGTIDVIKLNINIESALIGYCMSRKYWNQGIMTEALIEVEKFLFERVGLNRIEAYFDIRNPASGKVMEKAGMSFEGTKRQGAKDNKGNYCDISMYAILKSDWEKGLN